MSMTVRPPAVSGRFYPADRNTLLRDLKSYLVSPTTSRAALGCMVPHAGYMYSGHVAGAVYGSLALTARCVILGPNHTGLGVPLSIMSSGAWNTPLGNISIDSTLAAALKQKFSLLEEDSEAHRSEHAIEVQLPFLQLLKPGVTFVPITLGTSDYGILADLGMALAEVILTQHQVAQHEPILIIASSDMNHYENDAVTRAKDHKAIERIAALDAHGLFETIHREQISMCGYGPAIVMLTACKSLGARSAELIRYATSGDVSGDRRLVVGYAGMVVQ